MKVTAQHWGNSIGVRIPAHIVRETSLAAGQPVGLQLEGGRIVLTPMQEPRRFELKKLLAKITPGNLPHGDQWGAPVGKEVW